MPSWLTENDLLFYLQSGPLQPPPPLGGGVGSSAITIGTVKASRAKAVTTVIISCFICDTSLVCACYRINRVAYTTCRDFILTTANVNFFGCDTSVQNVVVKLMVPNIFSVHRGLPPSNLGLTRNKFSQH